MPRTLSSEQREYLGEQMDKVSRSFSLVAPEVDPPLDDYLAVAYLICRVTDNIEDTLHPFSWQKKRYAEFARLLDAPHTAESVLAEWETYDWPGLTGEERRMMAREKGLLLWEIYASLPHVVYDVIKRWTSIMAQGMARTNDPAETGFFVERNGIRMPASYLGYYQYCFYVAGTVGRMISDLAVETYSINGEIAKTLACSSEYCGRALQKTNIIKDFARDLGRGVSYLPDEWLQEVDYAPLHLAGAPAFWKRKVLLDILAELDASVNYVLALPQTAVGLRKAGLLMMMPAYETILQAAQRLSLLFTPDHVVKISRVTMGRCVLQARKIATDNSAIRAYVTEMSAKVGKSLDEQSTLRGWPYKD